MAITITIDNDQSTVAIDKLVLDESSGLQTPISADTGNDSNLDFADPTGAPDGNLYDGTLSGASFSASFLSFLNATTIFAAAGLRLTDVQKAYAAGVEGSVSAADFVKITTSAGEVISDLYFSDSSGQALNGDQVVGMQTLDGSNVYLWSDGDYCIATTSSTAGAGRVVAAFYLKDDAADHLTAQIQMVTFEPLKHPDGTNADDALDFTNVLQVSAAGTVSFNFDNLPSGSFLYAAVGSPSAGILVTGQDLNVIDSGAKLGDMVKGGSDPSDSVNTSQGGIGATIGINSQHFTDASGSGGTRVDGAVGVFTLVEGFTSFDATVNGTSEGTGSNVTEIGYSDYINAPSAKIFISQVTGSSSIGGAVRISLWEAGGGDGGAADHAPGSLTPEQGYGTTRNAYIGNDDTDQNLTDDWAVALGSVTVKRGATTYTWTSGNSGSTQGGITVTFGTGAAANTFTVTGLITSDTIGFAALDTASPLDGTFNRFDVQALANSNPVDIGRIDLDQGVSISQGVGGDLVVQDDHPTISGTITGAPAPTVDESNFAVDGTGNFAPQFTISYGTDGPAATPVTYALSTPGGNSGLVDTATLQNVVLSLNGSGQIEGRTATSNDLVFVISVDSTGLVTLDERRSVTHLANTSADQSTSMSSAALVVLTATAHDGDGDAASANLSIGTTFVFKDDAPTITAQILDGTVDFANDSTGTTTHSLNGSVGADVITNVNNLSQAGVKEYTITSFTDYPTGNLVYPNLDGVLSADGTTVTYYSTNVTADQNSSTAVYQLTLNQTANSGAGSYTFTVLQPPPNTETHFGFADLPSGQNLDAIIAADKTDLSKGGLLVFPTNPDINDGDGGESNDGTMTNASGTINTSKGGGPVTIGNGNQAFDNPDEGAWFMYVGTPASTAVGGLGLTQVTADDADTINFNGVIQATDASVTIVQASGAGTLKRPGPAMHITAYEASPGHVDTDAEARNLVNDPTSAVANGGTPAPEVNIIGVKIHDATGAVIEYDINPQSGGASQINGTPQDINGDGIADNTLVDIKFLQDSAGIYSAFIYNLKANYTVEFITSTEHDLAKVEWWGGSFDIGGFNISNQSNIPAQDFDFSVQITDYDNDVYGGQSVTFANFSVHVNDVTFV